jgi:YegS/Rv2252/BmrU family lipid kinase
MIALVLLHPDVSPEVVERFRLAGVELQIKDSFDATENYSAALIFGGDGTVHRHLPQLHQQKIPLLVVPVGSGNDFAKALGIFSVKDALQAWNQFCATGRNVHEIDLGVIRPGNQANSDARPATGNKAGGTEVLFCGVAGVGMDADANARANRMPAWFKRRGGYLLAGLRSLLAFKPVEMGVTAGERKTLRSAFFLAAGNAHRYGGGMRITPRATMNDGLLDVCLVNKMNKLKLLCWVPTIFFGGHLRLKQVEYFQSPEVRIEPKHPLDVYADGDYACQTPVEIEIIPRVLRVIVPALSHCK